MQTFDILGAIEFTAANAVFVFALATFVGETQAMRLRALAVLGAWFVLVVAAGAFGLFDPHSALGTPGLGIAVLAPIVLLTFVGLRNSAVNAAILAAPVPLLIAVHAIRVLGVDFLLLQADGRLPAPFAPAAGWGDILAGVTALPVAWAYAKQIRGARALALAWNSLGLFDLLNATAIGMLSAEGSPIRVFFGEPSTGLMAQLPWLLVPAFGVPLMILLHLAVFYRLASPRRLVAHA